MSSPYVLGYRVISVHWMTSDLCYEGARAAAAPFFAACEKVGLAPAGS